LVLATLDDDLINGDYDDPSFTTCLDFVARHAFFKCIYKTCHAETTDGSSLTPEKRLTYLDFFSSCGGWSEHTKTFRAGAVSLFWIVIILSILIIVGVLGCVIKCLCCKD